MTTRTLPLALFPSGSRAPADGGGESLDQAFEDEPGEGPRYGPPSHQAMMYERGPPMEMGPPPPMWQQPSILVPACLAAGVGLGALSMHAYRGYSPDPVGPPLYQVNAAQTTSPQSSSHTDSPRWHCPPG
jgi:hypothetical protein